MRNQKFTILGIAKDTVMLIEQKIAPNIKFILSDGDDPTELETKIKRTDAILLMSKDGEADIRSLKNADLEGKPVAVMRRDDNLKDILSALVKWAIRLRRGYTLAA
ncbi:MAG: hypothetical protein Q7R51_01760 [bacterium]|nr:hypothetical protein [bacterium]